MADIKQAHAGNKPYDENFYRANRENSHRRASIALQIVNEYVHPKTVIDIGCGVGGWLDVWKKNYGAKIYGIDGDYVDRNWLSIDKEFFHPHNLEKRINLNQKFDLAECLEVAEHLTPERADSFVEDLTKLSDVILFSAAIPGQGGDNHVNEQFQSYWITKFLANGYVCIDCIRPRIWNNQQIDIHYRNAIFIFVRSTELYRYPELQKYYLEHKDGIIYDVVHPEYWISRLMAFQNFYNQVQAQQSTPPVKVNYYNLHDKKIFSIKKVEKIFLTV